MAQGDVTLFEEFAAQLGAENHDFSNDTFKLGIIDNTTPPTGGDATPTWTDYSGNEVSTGGGYTSGGETLTGVSYSEVDGVGTFDANNIALSQNASGFTDGYWGILYNETNATDMAIAFVELGGPASEVAGPININWGASGIFTITIS